MSHADEANPIQDSKRRDPLLVLPPEIFCKSLSFLPPASITNSNAVSRDWRAVNLSDTSLYSELDLLDPKWQIDTEEGRSEEEREGKEMDLYFYHADLLASRANHRWTKVSINLTCFVRGFQQAQAEGISSESRLMEFFSSILCLYSQSLEEIRVRLDLPSPDTTEKRHDNVILLRHLTALINLFPKLKLIRLDLEGHSFIDHLEAGNDLPGSKKIIIKKRNIGISSQSERSLQMPAVNFITAFLKGIRENVGALTRFDLDTKVYQGAPVDGHDQKLVQELEKSKLTLQTLRLPDYLFDSYQGWLLLMNCPNLQMFFSEELRPGISLQLREEWEGVTLDEVESFKCFPNVHLETTARWESSLKWLVSGKGLIHLHLLSSNVQEGADLENPLLSPLSLGSILLNSKETLKHLLLCGVGSQGHQHLIESSPVFPNLENLHLYDTPQLWSSFSNLTFPKLLRLVVAILEASCTLQDHQLAFDCMVSLFTSTKSTLKTLQFEATSSNPQMLNLPSMDSPVIFPKLEILILRNSGCSEWFSNFQYPVLTKVLSEVDHLPRFRKNAPNLQLDDEFQEFVNQI